MCETGTDSWVPTLSKVVFDKKNNKLSLRLIRKIDPSYTDGLISKD